MLRDWVYSSFRWLFPQLSGHSRLSQVPSPTPAPMPPSLSRPLLQAARSPLIRFRFGGNAGGAGAPSAVAAKTTSAPPIGTTPRGSGVEEAVLPKRFQRRPIDDKEIDFINNGMSGLEELLGSLVEAAGGKGGGDPTAIAAAVFTLASSSAKADKTRRSLRSLANKDSPLLKGLLHHIEATRDDAVLEALLACVDVFLDSPRKWRRQKVLAAANAFMLLCRQLHFRLRLAGARRPELKDALVRQLLLVAARDGKASMKLRLSGVLPLLLKEASPSSSSLDLLVLASKSGRNAAVLGKEKEFLKWLVMSVKNYDPSDLGKLYRNVQILFFLSRTKKSREKLMSLGMTADLVSLFRALGGPGEGADGLQIAVLALGALRHIAKTKSGREELAASLPLLESAVLDFLEREDGESGLRRSFEDSVCSLCLRCLPSLRLALEGEAVPGHAFQLPSEARALLRSAPAQGDARDDSDGDSDEGEDALTQERDVDSQDDDTEEPEPADRPAKPKPKSSAVEPFAKFFKELSPRQSIQLKKASSTGDLTRKPARGSGIKKATPSRQSGGSERGRRPNLGAGPSWEAQYAASAAQTRSVAAFSRLAYPDFRGAYPDLPRQPLKHFPSALKEAVLDEIRAWRQPSRTQEKIVFDLDSILSAESSDGSADDLTNTDATSVMGGQESGSGELSFESRFESGNLRRATRTGPREYSLHIAPDANQLASHAQWFYFAVSGMTAEEPYTFTFPNFLKSHSMFSLGMQPVVFSVREAEEGRSGWVRAGHAVCYFRNRFAQQRSSQPRGFYSARFTITFRHAKDVCYLAYHYPYTYSFLKCQILTWQRLASPKSTYVRVDSLAKSLGGNDVPLLTITSAEGDASARHYVFLSARVHPGESNASWMMDGTISYLISPAAKSLREHFVFKIVPMLNPDGVVNGSHRCSLGGQDLNRQWAAPSPLLHPTIFAARGLLAWLVSAGRRPLVFCDFHGHSRRSNVFVFGNNPEESWRATDAAEAVGRGGEWAELAEELAATAPAFALSDCRFDVARAKESAARVVAWRHFRIPRAYTMEATYAGADQGAYAGQHLGTRELREMGAKFVQALLPLLKRMAEPKSATSTSSTHAHSDNED